MGLLHSVEKEENNEGFQEISNSDNLLILQATRKIHLIKSLNEYFVNGSRSSVYYNTIVGTIETTYEDEMFKRFKICSNIFICLFLWPVENSDRSMYISILDY